jgi:ubiquitin-conjugating enzyme E2 J1
VREASELSFSPSPDYHAAPASDSNLFEWHFTLRGPPSSPFASGIYHGRIVLPPTYPLRPPSFRFLTPSGRFETNREICLSISGHHEETWQPAWGIRTALVALRAFMETDSKGQLGGLDMSDAERRRWADKSGSWKCPTCEKSNAEIIEECRQAVKNKEGEDGEGSSRAEEVVPKELKIGFKNDSRGDETEGKASPNEPEGSSETPPPSTTDRNIYPAARPAQRVPQPTGTLPSTNSGTLHERSTPRLSTTSTDARTATTTPRPGSARQGQQRPTDEVAIWIDRAIAGILFCLVFMAAKMLLGFSF